MPRNDDAYCDCYEIADPPERPDPPEVDEDAEEPRPYGGRYPGDLHPKFDLDLY
jgi:hypothetical protein